MVLGAVPSPILHDLPDPFCVQTFKPYVDGLEAMGKLSNPQPIGAYSTVFVLANRHKDVNRLRFAQAWTHAQPGGHIIMSGHKTDGIDAFIKEVKAEVDLLGTLPKAHGKVFWVERADEPIDKFNQWLSLSEPSKNPDGYYTAAGMFSSAKVDPGSRLLIRKFDDSLKGKVADLGAGWGYLSVNLLQSAPKVAHLDLFEADHAALEAAKLNVRDPRAAFLWADVTSLRGCDNTYDLVISNPPFHQTRKSEPELGQRFIEKAAQILKGNGRFIMVANRQLPYEKSLDQHFRSLEKVAESDGYKLIVARNPRPQKRR